MEKGKHKTSQQRTNSFGTVPQRFRSYLFGRSQFVEINYTKSSVRNLTVGVLQGSILARYHFVTIVYHTTCWDNTKSWSRLLFLCWWYSTLYIIQRLWCRCLARLRVENCFADICHWMDVYELRLNHDKTEIMLIYSKYYTRPFFSYFSMGNDRLTTTANTRSLGAVLDDNMLFDVHLSEICRSSFYQLRNLSKIRKYLTHSGV